MPTLLLCDDNTTVQRMIAMTFAAENIAVATVADGEQAIARITREHPDIVLAATTTPKRTGYDVAAFVKSTPELAAIPVLLLSGAFEAVDEVRAAQVRCDGVLVKPLEPQHVVARVKELIAGVPVIAPPFVSGPSTAVERRAAPSTSTPASATEDYFEQLDAALAQRSAPVAPSRSADAGVVPTLDSVLKVSPPPAAAPPDAVVTAALIDEVTRRVIERLGQSAIKSVVADVVADVAERLIREEIARIRNK